MPFIHKQISREHAESEMTQLVQNNVPAKIRYLRGPVFSRPMYGVWVEEEDLQDALRVLDMVEVVPDSEPEPPYETILACPRCEKRRVECPDDNPPRWLFFVSVFLLMIPKMIWFFCRSMKGSKKRCGYCGNEWRSKP
ncbi:hypothetical protein CMV30_03010 [Nibricoccus aquaticus]|uniref:Uncharacterized protein n=1 Tax=Nibricoccus aquaticus TaxID=2576891 RepID=A0A290Q2W9_9BACT|nr:hypothetical protein [Nibricoccus aquaticus]ATC63015.1 hypothetical protein CMV30_03010 [Nibricoccus aquaticus]